MRKYLILIFALTVIMNSCMGEEDHQVLKPPKNGNIYVIAHRGAHQDIPENSLAAYQKAIDLGVDFVEIDVRTTSDSQFVSIHNSTIDAYVEGKSGKVEDFSLKELKSLDIGLRLGQQWKGTQIPTFEEILDLCKGQCGIYLDLKSAPIPALVKIIREKDMVKDIVWCLGDYDKMSDLHNTCPECLLMPDPGDLNEFAMILEKFRPIVVAPVWRDLSIELINLSHHAGALVFVDERDQESWTQALAWGVNGIQTDHPAALISFLKSNTNN